MVQRSAANGSAPLLFICMSLRSKPLDTLDRSKLSCSSSTRFGAWSASARYAA
jgi:hypothetical protein